MSIDSSMQVKSVHADVEDIAERVVKVAGPDRHRPAVKGESTSTVSSTGPKFAIQRVHPHHRRRKHESSYVCTEEEKFFQWDNIDLVTTTICDTITPLRLAQLAFPDASVFFDIGANRGYTTAKIFNLWSPGHGLNGKTLSSAIQADFDSKRTTNPDSVIGVCEEKFTFEPMVCVGRSVLTMAFEATFGNCQFRRAIKVISFDGQESHVHDQRKTIYKHFPYLHPNYTATHISESQIKASWEYVHAALTGPSLPSGVTHGYFSDKTDESGKLLLWKEGLTVPIEKVKLVPLLTVDAYCKQNGISTVDILKIDAEEHDHKVIEGAYETLRERGVKMLMFEGGDLSNTEKWKNVFFELETTLEFECFSNGEHDIMVRITNCWDWKYVNETIRPICTKVPCPEMKPPAFRLDGNIYCAHRTRAAVLVSLFSDMSLYKFAGNKRGDVLKDALLSTASARFEGNKYVHDMDGPSKLNQFYRRTMRDTVTGKRIWN